MRFDYNTLVLLSFFVPATATAMTYFFVFYRTKTKFMKYWAASSALYAVSLVLLYFRISLSPEENTFRLMLSIRMLIDMIGIILLLCGSYAFTHAKMASYWYRFGTCLCLWVLIATLNGMPQLAISFPVAFFDFLATLALCNNISARWNLPQVETFIVFIAFLSWGSIKGLLHVLEALKQLSLFGNSTEIIMFIIINLCILVVYIYKNVQYTQVSERLYNALSNSAKNVIFYYQISPYPSIEYITPSVEAVTGYTQEDCYAEPRIYLKLVDSERLENSEKIFTGESGDIQSAEFELIKKDGSKFWVNFSSKIIYSNNLPVALEGHFSDISIYKKTENLLETSRVSRQRLISYVSHELKTPITSILGYVGAITDGTFSTNEEKEQALKIIDSKVRNMEHLINDLFQLTKLESDQFSFNFMLVSATELSETLVNTHLHDIYEAKLNHKVRINEKQLHDVEVIADVQRIEQVFSNILSNALKHTPPGGSIRMSFYLDNMRTNYCVAIQDNGSGIDEKHLPHIFERFYSTIENAVEGTEKGSGLGLPISKEIIASHKGVIEVESRIGKGTKFTFKIPIYSSYQYEE